MITLVAQLIIPGSIFVISFEAYAEKIAELREESKDVDSLCPSYAIPVKYQSRIIMLSVALIYLSRIVLLAIKKGNDALNPDKGKSRPSFQTTSGNVLKLDTTLLKAMRFDRFMDMVYEPVVLCINLIMIFFTDSVHDMVLNSIAMEFICHLDEELQSFLFDLLEEEEAEEQFCVSYYEDATDSAHPETALERDSWNQQVDKWLNWLIFVVLVSAVSLAAIFVVYGPICKPGEMGFIG
jgi:hypothetical protein